ncbi:hypothetical protein HMPREF1624_00191 [Sporothrix schenckii ATCC 58251]|uniref:Transcription factor domain-containing protein n=1 Tax=Sporothrix schenckii (strain ATCC 58251 / de Perez 2211183) TaxID=1391915 RepID=U7Q5C3_SPOS1|nr:hypothetical protein HMPREF1624_00191 [Sporothrix schenckii ATCC 58251]
MRRMKKSRAQDHSGGTAGSGLDEPEMLPYSAGMVAHDGAGLECGGYERGRIFVHTTQHRPSALVSVRESAFAPGTTVDIGATPSSTSTSSGLASITNNQSRNTSIVSGVTPSPTQNSYDNGLPGGFAFPNGYANHLPNGLPNDLPIDFDDESNDYTNDGNGHTYDQPNALVTNYVATNGALTNATPPHTPSRQTPTLQTPRATPSPRRRPDLRIVPTYYGAGSSLGSDSSLIGSAREENLLATFWQAYLPNSTIFPPQAVGYASGGWTNMVQELYRKDPVLRHTLMANCFSAAARTAETKDDSRALAEQSLRSHGRALHELRVALDNPQKARSDSVFSTLRLMIVFSMFFSDRYEEDRRARARGWKEHNAGVLALLRARGPEAHISGHGHQMFVDCRLALIVAAMRIRKRSPLNSHQWMTIPWSQIPKTPKDRLIDIMSGMPTILENIDWLEQMPRNKEYDEFRRKVINTCWSYDEQLSAWYEENVPKDRLFALEQSTLHSEGAFRPLPEDGEEYALPTEDLSIVYIMTVYCTACLLLYSTMHSLNVPDLPERANVSQYINKIALYLQVFFHPSTGQYGLEMTSFPLGMCLQILSSNFPIGGDPVKERAKFTRLLETNRGKEILDFLRSMLNTNETTKS